MSGDQKPQVTLVIPAYNEERRLPASLIDVKTFFNKIAIPLEVLVIIEKSSDKTLEKAREVTAGDPRFVVVDNVVHRGKGYAVKSGMMKSRGDIVFFMDADLSTPLAEVVKFLGHFNDHPETHVVIGSRADAKSQVLKRQSLFRQSLGRGFNKFVQLFGIRGIKDTQCGFKAFRQRATKEVFSRQTVNGFAFDVEVLLLAEKMGFKIDVLPVKWVNSTDSKVRIFIDPLKMLIDLLQIRLRVRKTLRERPLSPSSSSSH